MVLRGNDEFVVSSAEEAYDTHESGGVAVPTPSLPQENRPHGSWWSRLLRYALLLFCLWALGSLANLFLGDAERKSLATWDSNSLTQVQNWDVWNFARVFWKRARSATRIEWWFAPAFISLPGTLFAEDELHGNLSVCWTVQEPDGYQTRDCHDFRASSYVVQKFLNLEGQSGHIPLLGLPLNIPFVYVTTLLNSFRESWSSAFVGLLVLFLGNLVFFPFYFAKSASARPGLLIALIMLTVAPWIGSTFMFVVAKLMYGSLWFGKWVAGVQTLTGFGVCGCIIDLVTEERKHTAAEVVAEKLHHFLMHFVSRIHAAPK